MPEMNIVQAVNTALEQEMERDDRVVVMGEDVGVNGGVFRATVGLHDKFGDERVIDTPLAEGGIVGTAIGMALYGLVPVPEIQFIDFVYPAYDQIVSEAAKYRYRSGGQYQVPMTIRSPYGGGIKGGHYHSQSPEAYFCHTPGLKVVIPSTPADTKGLLTASIRDPDPVIFLEPKSIYRAVKGDVPDGDHTEPLGTAKVVKEGDDVTLVGWGAMTHTCLKTAQLLEDNGGQTAEIVDVRTLNPLDADTIVDSVKRTGRAVVVHEAPRTAGFGAEISSQIHEEAILQLEAPVLRATGFDTPFPYSLEHDYMPGPARVMNAVERVLAY